MFKKKKNGEIFMIEQERERERKKWSLNFVIFILPLPTPSSIPMQMRVRFVRDQNLLSARQISLKRIQKLESHKNHKYISKWFLLNE